MSMQDRLIFVISPPRAGSTLLQRMLGSHRQIHTHAEPHLITPLAFLGYHDLVDKAPYDHINAAEAIRDFVNELPRGELDYLDALRAYADTLYGRMLDPSGRRYFLDKTPAYALVLPFLRKLYADAHFVVLTRHPMAVMSSYANSFFEGDWQAANEFNPVVSRYVPAMARLLRQPTAHVHHVGYEALVREPAAELARIFAFLGLPNDPQAVNYGERFEGEAHAKAGSGDPIGVGAHGRPVDSSLHKWVGELLGDANKRALAEQIAAKLDPDDVRTWGYDPDRLLEPLAAAEQAGMAPRAPGRPKLNGFTLQRKVMLALKKDIEHRPHGKLIQRVRYYCNVLLRE
jgi:Sulfotransferase family